jgi:hypothetical protein
MRLDCGLNAQEFESCSEEDRFWGPRGHYVNVHRPSVIRIKRP